MGSIFKSKWQIAKMREKLVVFFTIYREYTCVGTSVGKSILLQNCSLVSGNTPPKLRRKPFMDVDKSRNFHVADLVPRYMILRFRVTKKNVNVQTRVSLGAVDAGEF